jgi:hypothetical protein
LLTFGSQGNGESQFESPLGIACDSAGNVYVVDSGNHRIQKFTSGGVYASQWGTQGSGNGQFETPVGIAVTSTAAYVTDSGNDRVQQFDLSGAYQAQWGTAGTGDGQFTTPGAIAVGADGAIFVCDTGNSRVQCFGSNRAFQYAWGVPGTAGYAFGFWGGSGIAVTSDGRIHVADTGNSRMQRFRPDPDALMFDGAFADTRTTLIIDPVMWQGFSQQQDSFAATLAYSPGDVPGLVLNGTYMETAADSQAFQLTLVSVDDPEATGAFTQWSPRVRREAWKLKPFVQLHCVRVSGVPGEPEDFRVALLGHDFPLVQHGGQYYIGKDATTFAHVLSYRDLDDPEKTYAVVDPDPPHLVVQELTDEEFEAKAKEVPSNHFVARRLAGLMPEAELDVDASGTVEAHEGVRNYLPGYRSSGDPFVQSPVLSEGATFQTAHYMGQKMKIIIPGLGKRRAERVAFSVHATDWPGYCENQSYTFVKETEGDGKDLDYSFLPTEDRRTIVVTADGPAPEEPDGVEGRIEDDRTWVTFYCKDYGGACLAAIEPFHRNVPIPMIFLPIPFSRDQDAMADLWEGAMLTEWRTQFGQPLVTYEGRPQGVGDLSPLADGELQDPDGDGARPEHAGPGDGLTVFQEYRGFILDGGRHRQSEHPGGHRRLSAARKELLIEVSEMDNIADAAANGANEAAQAYTLAKTMGGVAELYAHPQRGAEIDLYWCRDDVLLGPQIVYNDGTGREHAYYYHGNIKRELPGGAVWFQGCGAFIHHDEILKREKELTYRPLFGGFRSAVVQRNNKLAPFVKLLALSRWGRLDARGVVSVPRLGPALSAFFSSTPSEEQFSLVAVNGISEEGPYCAFARRNYSTAEFENILQYSIAHELGHLLVREETGEHWDGYHLVIEGSVVGPHPGLAGITGVAFHPLEMKAMDLPRRASVRR